MASEKSLNLKKDIVNEITDKINGSQSVLLFSYQGLSVSDISKLRRELKTVDSEVKVYKNTLTKRALEGLNIKLDDFMEGPNAIVFGKDLLEPIKILADFAKSNDLAKIRVGIINGEVADLDVIKDYASIPSYEGLLTMFASGLIQHIRDVSISLDLYAKKLEGGE